MAMLTHELKTSLALIRFASRNALGKSQSGARIEQAVDDINAVIERCQQADKLEKGWSFSKQSHSVITLVQNCLDRLEHQDRVQVSDLPNLTISTDGALFCIILHNLLENALKYSPPGDKVQLHAKVLENPARLSLVVTNRIGNAGAPDRQRVFDKYYRSERALSTTGSGLGLYIVQALTQLFGGQVDYHHEGETVAFSMILPT